MLITKLRKPLALVLVFLMFFSMVPFGYAAELPASQFESGVDPPTEEPCLKMKLPSQNQRSPVQSLIPIRFRKILSRKQNLNR